MVDYEVNFNRREALWIPDETKVGVAYAMLDSDASIEDIGDIALQEAERPERTTKIRDLEIALVNMKNVKREHNPELYDFIQRGETSPKGTISATKKLKDLRYALQVAAPRVTNTQMADYLGNVMNDIYSGAKPGQPSYMSVVYRDHQDGLLSFRRS